MWNTGYILCKCCHDHTDSIDPNDLVNCPECGEPCQCRGCSADVEFGYEPEPEDKQ